MQDFAWDPLKDEIFMTQHIRNRKRSGNVRINRFGPAGDQGVRHFISSMTLTDAATVTSSAFSARGMHACCG
jgi:hypothetical protein